MENIQKALAKYWGFDQFLPLQKQAMQCVINGVDSVVILPTGGGKSLCFQAPAVTMPALTLVVCPLISLMKDQVDALKQCGITAERLDSSLSFDQQNQILIKIKENKIKLLYISPERLLSNNFIEFLRKIKLSFIAIDEAHCLSMWGHDFRPEYRRLSCLKQIFPNITIGAYTATATDQVQRDIAEQLNLKDPQMLIGSFDRPNLLYKVQPRNNILKQVCSVIDNHKDESGIIYCIRRKDVDRLCDQLSAKGYSVAPYHAGMDDEDRKKSQDMFISEKVDIIVATVAFGMGIDKSNVRYVIHAAMPKSIEHYQQESGRAGRDGLEAQCYLFYSAGDYGTWKSLMADMPPEAQALAILKLNSMYSFCTTPLCRHKTILKYFDQDLHSDNCNACDMCLGQLNYIDDGLITAQKILSCIVRVDQSFGGDYVTSVLIGSKDKRIIENNHDRLSTYGLLKDFSRRIVRDWIEQLAGQGYIERFGEYNILKVTEKGRSTLKGLQTPRLLKPAPKKEKPSKADTTSWQGVDKGLFELLRKLRSNIASQKKIPAFIVFGDVTLRDMAAKQPTSMEAFLNIKGVGQKKSQQYGKLFIDAIENFRCGNPV